MTMIAAMAGPSETQYHNAWEVHTSCVRERVFEFRRKKKNTITAGKEPGSSVF